MEWPKRKSSLRKPDWDYASTGHYFITICTWNRASLWGEVVGCKVKLSFAGEICHRLWTELPNRLDFIELGPFVLMPDHFHAIIGLPPSSPLPLGEVARRFKALSTQEVRQGMRESRMRVWQRGYHDRILRDRTEYDFAAQYILLNPEHASSPSWL